MISLGEQEDRFLCIIEKRRKMAIAETIAIVGLKSGNLTGFVENLAKMDLHLLIIPGSEDEMLLMKDETRGLKAEAEIEVLDCAKKGCWEADIIAFINPHDFDDKFINRIREVAVQKVIMAVFEGISTDITTDRYEALEKTFPHSKVTRLIVLPEEEKVAISGRDKEAVQKVTALLERSSYEMTG